MFFARKNSLVENRFCVTEVKKSVFTSSKVIFRQLYFLRSPIFKKYFLIYFVTVVILWGSKKVPSYSQSEVNGEQTNEKALGSAGLRPRLLPRFTLKYIFHLIHLISVVKFVFYYYYYY